jgi:hypothetical protein
MRGAYHVASVMFVGNAHRICSRNWTEDVRLAGNKTLWQIFMKKRVIVDWIHGNQNTVCIQAVAKTAKDRLDPWQGKNLLDKLKDCQLINTKVASWKKLLCKHNFPWATDRARNFYDPPLTLALSGLNITEGQIPQDKFYLNLTVKLTWCTSNMASGSHPAGDTIAFDRKTVSITIFFGGVLPWRHRQYVLYRTRQTMYV